MTRGLLTVVLLFLSNIFMTTAWYYHLKKREAWPLLAAIGISWLIALPEYMLQVPGNRVGHVSSGGPFTLPQLKILQESITLLVFTAFAIVIMHEKPRVNDVVAFMLILAAVVVSFWGRR